MRLRCSYPERYFFQAIKIVYPKTKQQYVVNDQRYNLGKQTFDIYIPELEVYVQYQGKYWHDPKTATPQTIENDNKKRRYIFMSTESLIEVWEDKRAIEEGSMYFNCEMENVYNAVTIRPNPKDEDLFNAVNVLLQQFGKGINKRQGKIVARLARNDINLIKAVYQKDNDELEIEYEIRKVLEKQLQQKK